MIMTTIVAQMLDHHQLLMCTDHLLSSWVMPDTERQDAAVGPPAELLDDLLMKVLDHMRAIFLGRIAANELSPPQFMLLKLLDEPQGMRRLADHLHCDASNLTGLADRLEDRHLVERRNDPADRRVKLLALTKQGRALRARLERPVTSELPGLAKLTPAERAELARLLRRVFVDS
jgi:DNA-binding MarR family transcriptional regulator